MKNDVTQATHVIATSKCRNKNLHEKKKQSETKTILEFYLRTEIQFKKISLNIPTAQDLESALEGFKNHLGEKQLISNCHMQIKNNFHDPEFLFNNRHVTLLKNKSGNYSHRKTTRFISSLIMSYFVIFPNNKYFIITKLYSTDL